MSRLVTCPSDPRKLALSPDGRRAVTNESGAPCVCGPAICSRVFRFVLCSTPLCWPPGVRTELFVCGESVVMTDAGPQALQAIIDAGGTVTARWSNGTVNPCYRFDGQAPRGTITTPGVSLLPGARCGTTECVVDLCGLLWLVRPCGNPLGGCGPVYVRAGAVGAGGVFLVNCGTEAAPRLVCYCLRPQAPTVREDQLPAGARIVPTPTSFFRDCCACGQALGRCQTRTYPEWIGRGADGLDQFRNVECCCPDTVAGIDASGFMVQGQQNLDGSGDNRSEITITGAVRCGNQWYFTGTYRQIVEGIEVFRQSLGCPGAGLIAYEVNTQCGGYLRAAEEDWRAPGGGPPPSLQGDRTISGACLGRSESWQVENIAGQQQGSTTRAYSSGQFSVRVRVAEDDACADDCSTRRSGGPSGTPIDPGLAAFLAGQDRMFGCKGCGQ